MTLQFSIWVLYWTERCSADPNKTWRVLRVLRIKSKHFPWKSWEPHVNWPGTVTSLIGMWREVPSLVTSLETFMADEGTWFNCLKKRYLSQCRPSPRLNTGDPGGDIQDHLLEQRACRFMPTFYLQSFTLLADCNDIMIYLKRLGFPTICDRVFFSVI